MLPLNNLHNKMWINWTKIWSMKSQMLQLELIIETTLVCHMDRQLIWRSLFNKIFSILLINKGKVTKNSFQQPRKLMYKLLILNVFYKELKIVLGTFQYKITNIIYVYLIKKIALPPMFKPSCLQTGVSALPSQAVFHALLWQTSARSLDRLPLANLILSSWHTP